MRAAILVGILASVLAIVTGVVCSVFGVSFFYTGPAIHSKATVVNEWLICIWVVLIICLGVAVKRVA